MKSEERLGVESSSPKSRPPASEESYHNDDKSDNDAMEGEGDQWEENTLGDGW